MAGFCGSCGTPRQEGAQFCMTCGAAFPVQHTCPTCGQNWPSDRPWTGVSSPAASGAAVAPAGVVWASGLYVVADRRIFFDGSIWCEATEVDGVPVANTAVPLPTFDPEAERPELLMADGGGNRVRGPMPGADYMPSRDCGNCGFPRTSDATVCEVCGTSNVGPSFDPSALN